MATIHEMKRRVGKVDLTVIGAAIVEKTKVQLEDKNRYQLATLGLDAKGRRLKRYASNSYAARKHSINPLPGFGNPDDKLTGEYHSSITLKMLSPNSFELMTPDSDKAVFLKNRDPEHLGLTAQSKTEYRADTMQPMIVKEVKKILNV